jgi:hypothetical protein
MKHEHAIKALTARLKMLATEYERIVASNNAMGRLAHIEAVLATISEQMKDIEGAKVILATLQGAEAEKVAEAELAEKGA